MSFRLDRVSHEIMSVAPVFFALKFSADGRRSIGTTTIADQIFRKGLVKSTLSFRCCTTQVQVATRLTYDPAIVIVGSVCEISNLTAFRAHHAHGYFVALALYYPYSL